MSRYFRLTVNMKFLFKFIVLSNIFYFLYRILNKTNGINMTLTSKHKLVDFFNFIQKKYLNLINWLKIGLKKGKINKIQYNRVLTNDQTFLKYNESSMG